MDWQPIILSLELAAVTTVLLLIIGWPIAFWLSQTNSRVKPVVESLIALPLVLPPTVIGFYLLVLLSPNSAIGQWLNESLGLQLVFSFPGLVIGSIIYSLPFMIQPTQAGFEGLNTRMMETARMLDKSNWELFRYVVLPNTKPALLTGAVLTFAHTMGEFGVVLMIGGNIPGSTRLASIAVFDQVETMNYEAAGQYALVLVGISMTILLATYSLRQRTRK